MRLAGERGWIPMTNLMAHHVRTLWETVEAGAASTGRTADRQQLRIGREVSVGATPASARARARLALGRPFDEHQYLHRTAQGNLRYKPRQDILSTSAELTGFDATLSLPQTSPLRGCERVVCNSLFIWALFLKHNILAISVVFSCPSGVREHEAALPPGVHPMSSTSHVRRLCLEARIPWKG